MSTKHHHYLPKHYLEGFTNSDGDYFVYDKKDNEIFPSNPEASFRKNHLNTVLLPDGNSSDFLESTYTLIENKYWNAFNFIRDSICLSRNKVDDLKRMHLFYFLSFLYWRLPKNLAVAEKLSAKFFLDDNEFDFVKLKSKTDNKVLQEEIDGLKDLIAFKKSSRIIIPFVPLFKDENWANKLKNWKFLYTEDQNSWYMVGDNPIISLGINDHDPVNCLNEFLFPISGKSIVISLNRCNCKELPNEFIHEFNTSVVERAQRFVACQNELYLKYLIQRYKNSKMKQGNIIQEMFEMFY